MNICCRSRNRLAGRAGPIAFAAAVALLFCGVASAQADDDAMVGRALFRRLWVPAPARTNAADGLGPLFNARSCASCHGAGGPSLVREGEDGGREIGGVVFRIADAHGRPHPWYGMQLQTEGVPGLTPEAVALVRLDRRDGRPRADVRLLGPELGPGFRMGARQASSLKASGAIERVSAAAIRERGSSSIQQGLGLAGRVRLRESDGEARIGRYGWKASHPDLVSQTAEAFAVDLGLSSPQRPMPYGDCTPAQSTCRAMPNGESGAFEGREISSVMVKVVARYVASLDRGGQAETSAGDRLLAKAGCDSCHVPRMPAESGGSVAVYSDLLLHDMGAALDDGVAEPGIRSAEWRTAPLIDLSPRRGRRRYLHDGRAGSIAEAIGWHGGEAQSSRDAFKRLSVGERNALVKFLEAR